MITVTGSTGLLGRRVAQRLSDLGVEQRLLVRDPARAPRLPGSHLAAADYGDSAAVRTALTDVDTVFMVSAAETPERVRQHLTFIDAVVEAGVRRIVYLSFFGASPPRGNRASGDFTGRGTRGDRPLTVRSSTCRVAA